MSIYTVINITEHSVLYDTKQFLENKLFVKIASTNPRGYSFKFLYKEDEDVFMKADEMVKTKLLKFGFYEHPKNLQIVDLGPMESSI